MSAAAGPAPTRFTFDLDLGRREERSRLLSESALAEVRNAARMEGYAQGFSEGQASVEAQAAQRLAAAGETLAGRGSQFTALLDRTLTTIRAEAAELSRDIARKLALHLVARQPEAELMALFQECVRSLADVPHVVIRCHPDLADRIREGTENSVAAAGFTGRVVVLGDPALPLSDGRIEWADGGLVRDLAAISAAVDAAIATYLSTHGKTK